MHEDGGSVGAGGEKAAVTERDLAVVPGQDVQSEYGDGIDQHHGQLEHVIIAQREWKHDSERDQRQ